MDDGASTRLLGRALGWGPAIGVGVALVAMGLLLRDETTSTAGLLDRAGVLAWGVVVGAGLGLAHALPAVPAILVGLRRASGPGSRLVPVVLGVLAASLPATLLLGALGWGRTAALYGVCAAVLALGPVVLSVRVERRRASLSR